MQTKMKLTKDAAAFEITRSSVPLYSTKLLIRCIYLPITSIEYTVGSYCDIGQGKNQRNRMASAEGMHPPRRFCCPALLQ